MLLGSIRRQPLQMFRRIFVLFQSCEKGRNAPLSNIVSIMEIEEMVYLDFSITTIVLQWLLL
jgi:hypothetical protein